jgi:hypothetical protein
MVFSVSTLPTSSAIDFTPLAAAAAVVFAPLAAVFAIDFMFAARSVLDLTRSPYTDFDGVVFAYSARRT